MEPIPPAPPQQQRPWMMTLGVSSASLSGALAPVCALLSPGTAALAVALCAVVVAGVAVWVVWRLQHRLDAAEARERRSAAVLVERTKEQHGRLQWWTEAARNSVTWLLRVRLPAAWAGREVPEASWPDDSLQQLFGELFEEAIAAAQAAYGRWAHDAESLRLVVVAVAQRAQTSALRVAAVADQFAERCPDPDVVKILMGVSHEAAQQARHAQTLQVLCGEKPGRRWQQPLALVEVVQAASGRITDYPRVQVTGDVDLAVEAAVVEPLIHLIAELLSNSTRSSPPNTRVHVHVLAVQQGVAVRVDDSGVGMTEHQLAGARVIASGERPVGLGEVGEVPQTGLPVIGIFARRLGLTVSMQPSPYGGIQVVVLIPSAMVLTLPPAGMQPAGAQPAVPGPPQSGENVTQSGLPVRRRNPTPDSAPVSGTAAAPPPSAYSDPARTGAVLDGLISHTRALSVDSGTEVGDDDGR